MECVIKYATEKHEGQRRKNSKKEEYIVHPLEVKQILSDHGVTDFETLAGAVLHDTIEDTSATHEEIKMLFGENIANIVQEVSDDKSLPKIERKKLQVSKISNKSYAARMIKIGDKVSNTKDLLSDPPQGWKEIDIKGYILWSSEVCKNAMLPGDTPKALKDFVHEHFNRLGIDTFEENTLERYYRGLI